LEERRARKQAAAERYARAQLQYVQRLYEEQIAPQLHRVFEGTCIGYDATGGSVEVRLDPASALLAGQVITARWYTGTLSPALVLGKRVKVIAEALGPTFTWELGAILE
jgi:hypothetical protein